jgi:1,4-dihydroxy-2-naphthoate octaprenyltransferase
MIGSWFLAARPRTLTASLVPVVVGTSLAHAKNHVVRLDLSFFAFMSAVMIQIATNFINDALDFEKGADTGERLGPPRAVQSQWMSASQVWWGGVVCFGMACLFAIPLVQAGGLAIVMVGLASLIAGYSYTGGPYPLAYLGWGDPFVLIFFGWVPVHTMYYLNTGTWDPFCWVAGTQVGLLATSLIALNHFRDQKEDKKAQKKTLSVRWGSHVVRWEIALLLSLPFLGNFFWLAQGWFAAGFLPVLILGLAWKLSRKVFQTPPGVIYNHFLGQAAFLHLSFGSLLALGFWLGL